MSYWDHPEDGSSDAELEFTAVWQRTPKLVLSRTLTSVGPNARLAGPNLAAEVTALRDAHEGNVGVSGTQAAAALVALDLIDAYQLYVHPVLLGAGTPMFPATDGLPADGDAGARLGHRLSELRTRVTPRAQRMPNAVASAR